MNALRIFFLLSVAWTSGLPLVARAMDASSLDALSRQIAQSRVVEAPAAITSAITAASSEDRPQVATTVVVAALRSFPAALGPCVMAAVRAAPESTDAIVVAASETLPNGILALVSAAADAGDAIGDRVIVALERRYPNRAPAFEREVALVEGRRLLGDRLPPAEPAATLPPGGRPATSAPPASVRP
ncbi:MAG: hypothetical protein KIT22_11495 [Verrucomicrobiae bacterium]|nr:hypothetical protein [Verrucomicrobiae bacterium]